MLHRLAILILAAGIWLLALPAQAQDLRRDACIRDLARSVLEAVPPQDAVQQGRIAVACRDASLTARGVEAARARFYAGRAYLYAGNVAEAVRQLTLAVNSGADFGAGFTREMRVARLALVDAYQAQGRIDLARATLEDPSLRPGDPAVAYKRALLNLAELGEAGEPSAFDALRSVFTQSDAQLAGTPDNPGLSLQDIRNARSWLYRLSVSLGARTLRLQAQASDQRRADARRAIDVLRPAVDAINAACPEPGPIDCANGIVGTSRLGVLQEAPRPSSDQLLNVYFQVGVAYLKAAGLQESAASAAFGGAGGIGGLGGLDCFESTLAPDAEQHFRDARFAFESFIRRSAPSGASAADARWGLACTLLADLRRVNDQGQRQRQIAQAIEQLAGAPQLPITFITLARAQSLQGQWDSAYAAYRQALESAGQTARCPAGVFDLSSRNQAELPSRIFLEMARTRFAVLEAFNATARAAPPDLYGRVVTQVMEARPGSLRDAEPELRCAVHLDSANVEARLALGHLYLRLGSDPVAGGLDAPPFPRAMEALSYFERPPNDNPEGRAEGLFLLSKRLTLTQQAAIDRGRSRPTTERGFREDGRRAVDLATQAYNLTQRPDFRRQACLSQILFGETDDQNYCAASGTGAERAEGFLYEGLYWLRRGQRERPPERLRSWSRSIQAFNRGVASAVPGQTVELGHPALPRAVDLRFLLSYGQRYVLQCTGLNDGDTSVSPDDVKNFFWLTGIPRQCGGQPS